MRNQAQAVLDDLFAQAEFDRKLFALRAAHPALSYELDELARVFRRARDRVAGVLLERVASPAALSGDTADPSF
ncbi:MAG TPA: hypothetical protein VH165_06435 [Kofleriaceae bacterium]|jgi:hypothetical protein|nr:hypothetical protein [Kofleriaceae bacterium]